MGTLWESHHTAAYLGEYIDSEPLKEVDGDTAYAIASISKIFAVLGLLLQEDVDWRDPVTKWVPELVEGGGGKQEEDSGRVDWESVTLESLGSQLSGILRDCESRMSLG